MNILTNENGSQRREDLPFWPYQDRVVCAVPSGLEVRESGIIVERTHDEHEEVEVLGVGPGKFDQWGLRIPMNINIGDKVIVNKFQVQRIRVADKDYLVVNEGDVRGVSHEGTAAA